MKVETKIGAVWFLFLIVVFVILSILNVSGQEKPQGMILGNPDFSAGRIQAKFSSGEWVVGRLEFSKSGEEVSCTGELHSALGVELSDEGDLCELAASQFASVRSLDIVVLVVIETVSSSPAQEPDFQIVLLGYRDKEVSLPPNLLADSRVSGIVSEIHALEQGRVLVMFGKDLGK